MTALPFGRSVPLVRRQLLARRGRTLAGVIGIAVALLLVLALKAIFAGMEGRLTAFIDGTGADVIVAQEGVTTMHMTQSALAADTVAAIAGVPGVASVQGIVYRGAFVETGPNGRSGIVALVGGGPVPDLVEGRLPGNTRCACWWDGTPSATTSASVLPKASASPCANMFAISWSCCASSE